MYTHGLRPKQDPTAPLRNRRKLCKYVMYLYMKEILYVYIHIYIYVDIHTVYTLYT